MIIPVFFKTELNRFSDQQAYSGFQERNIIMKALSRLLSMLLILALICGCTGTGNDQADSTEELFLSMTESCSRSLTFKLTKQQADQVEKAGTDNVTWTLHRVEPYGDPVDGKFIPIHGEEKMYPNEKEEIDFATITYNNMYDDGQAFSMEEFKTTLEGTTLKLDFTTVPIADELNVGMPHENGGRFIDICGKFTLTADLDGETLASLDNVVIKPYASFHTMWEMYDEILRLSKEGDDDSATATPYVEYGVMGQSYLGYDMPYLIVARDSASVKKWLDLSKQAEESGTAAVDELRAANDEDYQVPVMYSNVHANEIAAADAVLELARLLIEEPTIEYKKLTGFTEEGKAVSEKQREEWNIYTPKLLEDQCGYLGSIWRDRARDSGVVDGFDTYYNSEMVAVNVAELLNDVFFILVPEQNVDARLYYTRASASGINLNRDNSYQTAPETRNMQHLIGFYDPVTLVELHGAVTQFQVEPASPPHQPNFEYDLIARQQIHGGEEFGTAAVANNPSYQSYIVVQRDLMSTDEDGTPYWTRSGDDYPVIYTPTYAMLHGCVGYTVELPAYNEATRQAGTYGFLGLADYVAANKEQYFANLAEIYSRGIGNKNSDSEVAPWYTDKHDNIGAEAEIFRPEHTGEGENGQFFPECYLIPLNADEQRNLQGACEMIEYLTRNDVKVGITGSPVTVDGKILPEGTAVVSMYQAKRSVANFALYDGTLVTTWDGSVNEAIGSFSYTRGFDMVTCVRAAEYEAIRDSVSETITYDNLQSFLEKNAVSQFNGIEGADVIIANVSEDAVAAVNSLLRSGKQVGMITTGAHKGNFICSYDDWKNVSAAYILSGTGVNDPQLNARIIERSPKVYVSGTKEALTPEPSGFIYNSLVSFFSDYNLDKMALEMMGFEITEDAAKAEAVVGAIAPDEDSLKAVQTGIPYVGYTDEASESIQESLLPEIETAWIEGVDCLGYVTYPEETLTNASYIRNKDDVFYGAGTSYFTALPEGAKVLVKRDGSRTPLEGYFSDDEENIKAFLNGIMGFSYKGEDKDGNEVNVTLFANSLNEGGHQRDEYRFISNALFESYLSETAYVTNN